MAGSEMSGPEKTWPALYAQEHDLDYQCLARPGHTSQYALRTLYESIMTETGRCLYVIHWPNAVRFEYADKTSDQWVQITPNSLHNAVASSRQVRRCYYADVNSELGEKWHNLLMIASAVSAVKNTQHRLAMTTADDFLFDTQWHNPLYVQYLQDQTRSWVLDFDGLNFERWCKINNFPIGPAGHPLEQAHQAACALFGPYYDGLTQHDSSN